MKENSITLLQQRDFGQKINASFDFSIKNLSSLALSLLFIAGPSAILSGIAQGVFQSRFSGVPAGASPAANLYQYLTLEYFFVGLFAMITYFLACAVVSAFMVLYENNSLIPITPGAVWQKIIENFPVSFGAQLMAFLLILIGTLLFVIPGIYLVVCFQFCMMVAIREKLSVTDTLRRSYKLTNGKWWSTFGIIMIMSIIAGIISILFQFPVFVVSILNTLGMGKGLADSPILMIGINVISMVGSCVVQGIVWVAVGFQYYNLVERLDGSALRTEIESLGSADAIRPREEF